ncbi:probable acyl-activating enzyme 1 peroxisomal [Phtheirospermum japonicum]|uniref:Probable acyl-activating enzyme 1 peroxisomal n=1 Tax=Phtheirospermum japonicum TaxID=374723 RepID=A0A830C1W4_9LAMI|nr:probable acyl-activating enzyme 1 peroxisomal [Phtheirospermum japonicum]
MKIYPRFLGDSGDTPSLVLPQLLFSPEIDLTMESGSERDNMVPENTRAETSGGVSSRPSQQSVQDLQCGQVSAAEFVQVVHGMLSSPGINLDVEKQSLLQTALTLQQQLEESQAALLLEQEKSEMAAKEANTAKAAWSCRVCDIAMATDPNYSAWDTGLLRSAIVYRDGVSIVYGDMEFTWKQNYDRCLRFASALSRLGISRGDVVSALNIDTYGSEIKRLKAKMVASRNKVNGILDQELEKELMKFTTKYKETKAKANLVVEQTQTIIYRDADVEVDIITRRAESDGDETVEAERMDSTESSSSFDGSVCGVDDFDASGETEVLSDCRVDAESAMNFDAFHEFFRMRKRKLTNHWRSFINPLMWRCKWVELQIKRFEAEAQKYDRELERYRQQKLVRLKGFTLDDLGVKSLPFSENRMRKEVFTRKKRIRDEATEDLSAYMSRHNLFSHYAQSTQKVNSDDEFWGGDDLLCVDDGDDDDSVETIFRKIDFLQSRVGELRSRADKINNENGFFGSSLNNDDPTNDDLDGLPMGAYIMSQLIALYRLSELVVPKTAVKSCEEVVCGANARTNRVHFDPIENDDYGVLIDDPRMKKQMNNFEELKIQPIQRPVLAESNRLADDKRSPSTRSILKTAMNPESKNKRKIDGSRVRFAI